MALLELDTDKIPAQREFMESLAPELLYSGAFGAGKTRIGCEKGYFFSIRYPGNKGLIVRKEFSSLKATTMDTWFRYVCPEEVIESYNKQDHLLKLKNGSEVLFAGLDKASKVGSFEAGWIFPDETIELLEEDYIMLLGRLRFGDAPFHQIFGATNPSDPNHWLYRRFYDNEELKQKGTVHVIESDANANPFNPETYRERLATFKGKYHDRYVLGKWVSFDGLVYDCWDPEKHILPRDTTQFGLTGNVNKPIPDGWEHYRAIDFGFTNPFVCHWWAVKKYEYKGKPGQQDRVEIPPEDRKYVLYKQIYYAGRTVDEHAKTIKDHTIYGIHDSVADWDSGDREILARAGVHTTRAEKDVPSGIQTTYSLIANDQIYILEGSLIEMDPELERANKPTKTEDEFFGYNRPKGKDGQYDPKENPVKLNDHGMDTMRYLFYTFFLHTESEDAIRHSKVSDSIGSPVDSPAPMGTGRAVADDAIRGGSELKGSVRSWRSFGPSWSIGRA